MPLLLPNLDDRTWAELVDEGRSLIPVYGPEWTDHNASDPGITLIELLAWIAEMDIYELNQVSDQERLKFLKLVGIVPQPPLPAHATVQVTLKNGAPLTLPAGVEFAAQDSPTTTVRFRTYKDVTLVSGTIATLQFRNGNRVQDLTASLRRRAAVYPFGLDPQPRVEFYLGLSAALPAKTAARIFFTFGGDHSSCQERLRILKEERSREKDCRPFPNPCKQATPDKPCHCEAAEETTHDDGYAQAPLKHFGARTVWEFQQDGPNGPNWTALEPAKGEVEDNTRSFTLDGSVVFEIPGAMAQDNTTKLYYLRCRFAAGAYDAAPILTNVALNGIPVEQAVPAGKQFVIAPGATISGKEPNPNDVTALTMTLDATGKIIGLNFSGGADDPAFRIYDYRRPMGGACGKLALEGVFLGFGNGFPHQQFTLPDAPVKQEGFQLYTLEKGEWHAWKRRPDFETSTRRDFHFLLDPSSGTVTFGTGEKGRVPPEFHRKSTTPQEQCLIFARYQATRAEAGNLAANTIQQLADSPHNRAILFDSSTTPDGWTKVKNLIQSISNPLPASGGAAAETIAHASGQADQLVAGSDRAVTLADYERLALQIPGTRVARVTARANLHPSFPCFKAPGVITVIVLPFLPQGHPNPSPGLLQAMSSYLRRRRVVGTRVEVIGPTYLELAVQAEVQAQAGVNKAVLQTDVVAALNKFLDPLQGGPDGAGWPFGRDVYRSEIMRVIDEVPGVDYVASLALVGEDGQPQCGNVCLGPTWLVEAGNHQITVL